MATRREGRDRLDAVLVVGAADGPHRSRHVVGIHLQAGDEAMGVLGKGARRVVAADPDHADGDAKAVHETEGHPDRVLALGQLVGHLLEHVLDRELGIPALLAEHRTEEVVLLVRLHPGKADHEVDDGDVGGHRHGRSRYPH